MTLHTTPLGHQMPLPGVMSAFLNTLAVLCFASQRFFLRKTNEEEELTTPGFGNDVQKKYAEFRELGLFTDLTLKIKNETYKVPLSVIYCKILRKRKYPS